MTTSVHVDRTALHENEKQGTDRPVLVVKRNGKVVKGNSAVVRDADGNEVGRFVYEPDAPRANNVRVWFETDLEVEVAP